METSTIHQADEGKEEWAESQQWVESQQWAESQLGHGIFGSIFYDLSLAEHSDLNMKELTCENREWLLATNIRVCTGERWQRGRSL
ncbi:hypothetical protein EYF80_048580 [Liparis tanakae]|uniref:Uncharacterized protein n=1 Tax=Liparis tanakae TaxID=230148 RepID=A0A4Z2FJU7_9TELE|nr:hypothetical protein EYF80_048580 [Liparis tanakae]